MLDINAGVRRFGGGSTATGREDRHQFHFIVSAEDGVELSDPARDHPGF
jgi:hypothetical protein